MDENKTSRSGPPLRGTGRWERWMKVTSRKMRIDKERVGTMKKWFDIYIGVT
jgi:hypothetical protein